MDKKFWKYIELWKKWFEKNIKFTKRSLNIFEPRCVSNCFLKMLSVLRHFFYRGNFIFILKKKNVWKTFFDLPEWLRPPLRLLPWLPSGDGPRSPLLLCLQDCPGLLSLPRAALWAFLQGEATVYYWSSSTCRNLVPKVNKPCHWLTKGKQIQVLTNKKLSKLC